MEEILPWKLTKEKPERMFQGVKDFSIPLQGSANLLKTLDSQMQTDDIDTDYFANKEIFNTQTEGNRIKTPALGSLEYRIKSSHRHKKSSSFINEYSSASKKYKPRSALRKTRENKSHIRINKVILQNIQTAPTRLTLEKVQIPNSSSLQNLEADNEEVNEVISESIFNAASNISNPRFKIPRNLKPSNSYQFGKRNMANLKKTLKNSQTKVRNRKKFSVTYKSRETSYE